jgi:FkbM family methyltransferase
MTELHTITRDIRGLEMKFAAGNRSLELCSQMNYETEVLDLIDSQKEGAVFYDVGACEGRFAVYAALKGLRVFAFEPDERNFVYLQANCALNGLGIDRLRPFNVALGEQDRQGIIKIGQPWAGGHQKIIENPYVRKDLNFDFKETATVAIVAMDSFIAREGITSPQCMKVDIDGSERSFIEGAGATLSHSKLGALAFELEIDDPNFSWIIDRLGDAGFIESSRHAVPNEPKLFNIIYLR